MPACSWQRGTAVEEVMRTKGRTARATEAAVLLLSPDGAIRVMVGGRNHADSQFNRAVRAMRQPGSAFKPFIYLAAIESGFTPETQIDDSPIETDGWKPTNFGGTYRGKINLRTALTHSSNVAAVRLMQAVGSERVVEVANRLGVRSARNVGPTLALGTSETTLLEMTSSFAVFANGGLAVVPGWSSGSGTTRGTSCSSGRKRTPPRIVSARDDQRHERHAELPSWLAGRATAHPSITTLPGAKQARPKASRMPGSSATPRNGLAASGWGTTMRAPCAASRAARFRPKSGRRSC